MEARKWCGRWGEDQAPAQRSLGSPERAAGDEDRPKGKLAAKIQRSERGCGNSTRGAGCRRALLCFGPESNISLATLTAGSRLYLLWV